MVNIEKVGKVEIKINYEDIVDDFGDKCCDKIKSNVQKQNLVKRGKYLQGWKVEIEDRDRGGHTAIVYNETDWQLTHLLENGHLIVNKRGGTGWASAHPHINPAYKSLRNKFIKAMSNADFKIKT